MPNRPLLNDPGRPCTTSGFRDAAIGLSHNPAKCYHLYVFLSYLWDCRYSGFGEGIKEPCVSSS